MKRKNTTLAELFITLALLCLVFIVHFVYWTFHTSGMRDEISRKKKQVVQLKREITKLKKKKKEDDRKASLYVKQIRERKAELEEYGDFLPSVSTKPLVIKEILTLVEELGINISTIENHPMKRTEGSFTFNFTLALSGPYKAFKLFLARIYKSERIFRIKRFDIGTFDNPQHNMEVMVEFQTYFAAN